MGKLVDELLAYLSKASKEQLVKDWEELKEFNEVGPEVTSFIEQSLETIQICDSVPEIAISNKFGNPEFTPKGEYVQSEGLYNLDFIFKAWEKGEEQSNPKILVNCVASFKFKENISLAEIPNFFYPNSIAILFPYVRAFVSTLTLQANIKPILLPTLNLSSLQDILRENTTTK